MSRLPLKGQSTLEYGLIAGLVSLCAMGALMLLGDNTKMGFKGILSSGHVSTTVPIAEVSNTSVADNSGLSGSGDLGAIAFTLSNGTSIKLEQYPTDYKKMIETTGANGYTAALANNVESLVEQLQDAGTLTASQASALVKLANQGHKIAEVQKLLEEMAANSSSTEEFNTMRVTLGGQTYSSQDLINEIGYSPGPEGVQGDGIFDKSIAGYSTVALLEAYDEAIASGALQDPVVQQVVTALTKQIAMSSEITQHVGYPVAFGGEPIDLFAQQEQATATNLSSVAICQQGSGTDSGIQCSAN